MPIFASTTTSGYSDPLKAMSIKALEARLKDQQAQMAAQQPDAAMMGTIPGGIGHVLGVVGDKMAQGRNEQAIAAQKQELARRMSGYDVTGDTPPPPDIVSLAPDVYKDMMQTWAQNRLAKQAQAAAAEQARLGREHTSTESGLTRQQQKELQAGSQAHASTESGLTRQQQKELADATNTRIMTEGNLTREQQSAMQKERIAAEAALEEKKVATAAANPTPQAIKAQDDLKGKYIETSDAIGNVERLIGLHKEGIDFGIAEPLRTFESTTTGGALNKFTGGALGTDEDKARRTVEFNRLTDMLATKEMSQALTGSTTNFELQHFIKIYRDPRSSEKDRADALTNLMAKVNAYKASQSESIGKLKGSTAAVDEQLNKRVTRTPDAPATANMPKPAGQDDASLRAEAEAALAKPGITPQQAEAIRARMKSWGL